MYVAITVHHPADEHEAEFVEFMREVMEGIDGADGLRQATVCRASDGSYVAGYTVWDDDEAFQASLPKILAFAPRRKPEWTTAPDEAIRLNEI